ncbi:putative GTP-binding protein Rit1 [Apostichopus japonicus]|uniref:Putative GTP-binding protein Rit1 n=1 Tax=Stichopus japonicus TaxID=307972 RepID=A0A2G8LJ14_STIJA|nr:putative GTP-binding protein Rit1 [Apostichopus japonicus]
METEDAYQQQAVIDGEVGLLDILDTAGQAEFTAMRDQYMRGGEGFIICYSITDKRSFQEAAEFKNLIERVRTVDNLPIVLVGNKCDLDSQRVVSVEDGQTLARQFGCPFFETSAALRHYVDDVFHTLVREIRRKERAELLASQKKSRKRDSSTKIHTFVRKVFSPKKSSSS